MPKKKLNNTDEDFFEDFSFNDFNISQPDDEVGEDILDKIPEKDVESLLDRTPAPENSDELFNDFVSQPFLQKKNNKNSG